MINPGHLNVLRRLHARLNATGINWAVTGSLGFALQGVPVEPHDIDIQSDAAGVYEIQHIFSEFVLRPVSLSSKHTIRSHFGALLVDGVEVELMGDVQKPDSGGMWDAPTDLNRHKRFVEVEDMRIPVLSLEYEEQAYRKMGRVEKAEMLRQWLQGQMTNPRHCAATPGVRRPPAQRAEGRWRVAGDE